MAIDKDINHNTLGEKNRLHYINEVYPRLKLIARETHKNIKKSFGIRQIKDFNEPTGWLELTYDLLGKIEFQESKVETKRSQSSKFMRLKHDRE